MELLSTVEINHIIASLDANTSIFRNCRLFNPGIVEPHLMSTDTSYLVSRGVSLTEIIKTHPVDVTNTGPVAFLKMWFTWPDVMPAMVPNIEDMYNSSANAPVIFNRIAAFVGSVINTESTTSLIYESNVYEYITQNIIIPNVSPNFIPLITRSRCPISNIINSLEMFGNFPRKANLLEKLNIIHNTFPMLDMMFIMTGSSPTIQTMLSFLNDLRAGGIIIQNEEYESIIFQFFYTFYVMNAYEIVHNDNHFENTMIQTLPAPVTLDITIGGFRVQFSTRYIVKYFDWDRGFYTAGGQNPIIDLYTSIRTVNTFTPGRDFSAFICFLYDFGNTTFNAIIDRLILGPKPTEASNPRGGDILIPGVPRGLRIWINNNPGLTVWNGGEDRYITIPKADLERILAPRVIATLRAKLGNAIYDNRHVTNIYIGVRDFGLFRESIFIPEGWTCHPLYDNSELDVVRFFTTAAENTNLCMNLQPPIAGATRHVYAFIPPAAAIIQPGLFNTPAIFNVPVARQPLTLFAANERVTLADRALARCTDPARLAGLAASVAAARADAVRANAAALAAFGGGPPPVIGGGLGGGGFGGGGFGGGGFGGGSFGGGGFGGGGFGGGSFGGGGFGGGSFGGGGFGGGGFGGGSFGGGGFGGGGFGGGPLAPIGVPLAPIGVPLAPVGTRMLSASENFLFFANYVLNSELARVVNRSLDMIIDSIKQVLIYITNLLYKYLTVENIIDILKIAIYKIYIITKFSYEEIIIPLVRLIIPYVYILGTKINEMFVYIYNVEYKESFYNMLLSIFGQEQLDLFRDYIIGKTNAFLEIPQIIKQALHRRINLFGNRDTRGVFRQITGMGLANQHDEARFVVDHRKTERAAAKRAKAIRAVRHMVDGTEEVERRDDRRDDRRDPGLYIRQPLFAGAVDNRPRFAGIQPVPQFVGIGPQFVNPGPRFGVNPGRFIDPKKDH